MLKNLVYLLPLAIGCAVVKPYGEAGYNCGIPSMKEPNIQMMECASEKAKNEPPDIQAKIEAKKKELMAKEAADRATKLASMKFIEQKERPAGGTLRASSAVSTSLSNEKIRAFCEAHAKSDFKILETSDPAEFVEDGKGFVCETVGCPARNKARDIKFTCQ